MYYFCYCNTTSQRILLITNKNHKHEPETTGLCNGLPKQQRQGGSVYDSHQLSHEAETGRAWRQTDVTIARSGGVHKKCAAKDKGRSIERDRGQPAATADDSGKAGDTGENSQERGESRTLWHGPGMQLLRHERGADL